METLKCDFTKLMTERIVPKTIELKASRYGLGRNNETKEFGLFFMDINDNDLGFMPLTADEYVSCDVNLFQHDEDEEEPSIIEEPKPSFDEKRKPNGEELYQDGISLQNERVKHWTDLGFKVLAGYVHDKSDLLISDAKGVLWRVESFKCFKLDKQRRSGSHCRTIRREDLTPEIRDALSSHVPLFLTVQNILDKSKVISFEIDPSTFDHWTTPPELAIE